MRLDKFPILIHFDLKIYSLTSRLQEQKNYQDTEFGTYFKPTPMSSRHLTPIHCVGKESSRLESMNRKHHSNRQSFISFVIAQHSPSLTHQKLIQLLHFSSLTILIYRKGFKSATANENVEWTLPCPSLVLQLSILAVSKSGFIAPLFESGLHKSPHFKAMWSSTEYRAKEQ